MTTDEPSAQGPGESSTTGAGVLDRDWSGHEAAPVPAAVTARDAHAVVDPEAVLADVTVVVPTNRAESVTLESVPEFVAVEVRRDDGLNVARNAGVEAADTDWIVIADDDVTFPTALTAMLVDAMHERHLVGLEDFWPLRWIIGRYMVFHRSLWEAVGGFDAARPHGGDTDFAIRCEKAGARVDTLPRKLVPHHDEESQFTTAEHAEWLWYLLRRHPRQLAGPAARLALSKLGLASPRADYPSGWTGTATVPPDTAGDDGS